MHVFRHANNRTHPETVSIPDFRKILGFALFIACKAMGAAFMSFQEVENHKISDKETIQ